MLFGGCQSALAALNCLLVSFVGSGADILGRDQPSCPPRQLACRRSSLDLPLKVLVRPSPLLVDPGGKMSEFEDASELSAEAEGADFSSAPIPSRTGADAIPEVGTIESTAAERALPALNGMLRLALRASDADVTCVVVRERIVLWASRRRSSATTEGAAAALFAADDEPAVRSRSTSVLSRWLIRSKTVRVPVNKDLGVYLVAARRRSRTKFGRSDATMLQDAARLAAGEIDSALGRLVTKALSDAIDTTRLGVILADMNGQVLFSNGAARRFIAAGNGLRITDHRITGTCAGDQGSLREALSSLSDMKALSVAADDGSFSAVVARRLNVKGRTLTALFVDDPEHPTPPAEWLRAVYRMTKREAEVSALLAGGLNVSEVAEQLGLSETTVKSYCKDVFAKLDVRRKPDLVRTLSGGPLTLVAPLPPKIESGRATALPDPFSAALS